MTTKGLDASESILQPLHEELQTTQDKRARRRWRRQVRPWFVRIHRWVGLGLGVWVIMMSVTGFILVFQDQINAWLHPEWFQTTTGDLGPQAAVDAAQQAYPDWTVTGVTLPELNDGVYAVHLEKPEEGPPNDNGEEIPHRDQQIFVDPGSAAINGLQDYETGFVDIVYRLHDELLLDEIGGVKTTTIIGWLGVLWLFSLITGAVPGLTQRVRRWRQLLRIRRGQSVYLYNFDLHRTLGLLMLVPLLLVVFTGIQFMFFEQMTWLWEKLTPSGSEHVYEPPADLTLESVDTGTRPLDADTLLRLLRERHPDGTVAFIGLPPADEPTGTIEAYVSNGYDPWATQRGYAGNVGVYMDQYSGEELWVGDPRNFSAWTQFYDVWAFSVHAGSFGRTPTRIVWLVLAAGSAVSGATGYLVWLSRRRLQKAHARPSTPATPAARSPAR
jgi:uncharacterized iron-regulated membrane protein